MTARPLAWRTPERDRWGKSGIEHAFIGPDLAMYIEMPNHDESEPGSVLAAARAWLAARPRFARWSAEPDPKTGVVTLCFAYDD